MIYQGKQKIWSDYQKEIPEDHWFYVRSCIRQSFFPGAERQFMSICRDRLGHDIYETAHHTTCGGIAYHSDVIPQETAMTIVARQFAMMTEAGYKNLVASCITSFGNYTETLETWREFPELEAKVREHLWKACRREFEKPEYVAHASDLVYKYRDEIAARARFRLVDHRTGEPLRVVEHIGCHYSKMFPHKGVGGAEYPCVLSGMAESWGGQVIDYPERRHCCGFGFRQYLVRANRGYSVSNTHKKFESMEPYHPDVIITRDGFGIPVLTYEELAGLVLGVDPWDLGLQIHQVSVEPLLDKMGVPYDPSRKYLGLNEKEIMRPGLPSVLRCC